MTTTECYRLQYADGDRLHGYQFLDLAQALAWLRQGWMQTAAYEVRIQTVEQGSVQCPNCGFRETTVVAERVLPVREFLAQYGGEPVQGVGPTCRCLDGVHTCGRSYRPVS